MYIVLKRKTEYKEGFEIRKLEYERT